MPDNNQSSTTPQAQTPASSSAASKWAQSILTVLGWLFGGIFIFSGLVTLFSGPDRIGGALVLLFGITIFPVVAQTLKTKAHFDFSPQLRVLVSIVLFIGLAVWGTYQDGGFEDYENHSSAKETVTESSESSMQTIVDSEHGFFVIIPDTWSDYTDTNEEVYMLSVGVTFDNYVDFIVFPDDYSSMTQDEMDAFFMALGEVTFENFLGNDPEAILVSQGFEDFSGTQSYVVYFTSSTTNQGVHYDLVRQYRFFSNGETVYAIEAVHSQDASQSTIADLEAILDSFTFL